MFNKNLRFYRLKRGLSKKALASLVGVSPMAIGHYESGERRPENMDIIKNLAQALQVRVSDFLTSGASGLKFVHAEFRKKSSMSQRRQDYIRESVEQYFGRFFTIIEVVGGAPIPPSPPVHKLKFDPVDMDSNAQKLRRFLDISESGPVGNLSELMENRGILLYFFEGKADEFYGINGTVNGRPYIAVNSANTAERIRSTIVHEIIHSAFLFPENMTSRDLEKAVESIAGRFLIPHDDMIRELGLRRQAITQDMLITCEEYGISLSMLAFRASECRIVTKSACKNYWIHLQKSGGRKTEISRIKREEPSLFKQLVYRAVTENDISYQRGAELLECSLANLHENCRLA